MTFALDNHRFAATSARKPNKRENTLAPNIREIQGVFTLFVFTLMIGNLVGTDIYPALNVIAPLCLAGILSYANWRMIQHNGRNLWTALFWFRFSTTVYFCIGTIFVYIVNDATWIQMQAFFRFTDADVYKLNLIVSLSTMIILLTARLTILFSRNQKQGQHTHARQGSNKSLLLAAIVFLSIGLIINYAFAIPYQMGWVETTLSGAVMNLTRLIPVGTFFLTLWGLRNAKWLLPFIFILVAIEIVFSLLLFLKSSMLLMLIMVSLAFLWDKVTLKKLSLVGAVIISAYLASIPVVDSGRYEISLRYGSNTQASFGERFGILSSYLSGDRVRPDSNGLQSGLSRFSYVNAATFVIHLYDSGQRGDWPKLLPATIIPRVLWPEKPNMTAIGMEIYQLATGSRRSFTGAGIFADAYWAMGWGGVIIYMSFYGAVIGALTNFASNVMRKEQWLYFPIVLLGLTYGMRTDGHYISDVAGSLVIIIALWFILYVLDIFLKSSSTQ